MPTLMPRDDNLFPIPALRLRPDGAHALAVGTTSVANARAFAPSTCVVGIYATGPVFLRTGEEGVTASASDHYFPANTYYDLALGDRWQGRHTHIAAMSAAGACTLYISEKE